MNNPLRLAREAIENIEIIPERDGSKRYKITIYTKEESAALAVEVVHMLLGLSDQLLRSVKNLASQDRACEAVAALQAQRKQIASLYQEFRAHGYLHRQAIDMLTMTKAVQDLDYDKAEIGRCVKAYHSTNLLPTRAMTDKEA